MTVRFVVSVLIRMCHSKIVTERRVQFPLTGDAMAACKSLFVRATNNIPRLSILESKRKSGLLVSSGTQKPTQVRCAGHAKGDFCHGHAGVKAHGHTDQVTVRACRPPHAVRIASLTRCWTLLAACDSVLTALEFRGEREATGNVRWSFFWLRFDVTVSYGADLFTRHAET